MQTLKSAWAVLSLSAALVLHLPPSAAAGSGLIAAVTVRTTVDHNNNRGGATGTAPSSLDGAVVTGHLTCFAQDASVPSPSGAECCTELVGLLNEQLCGTERSAPGWCGNGGSADDGSAGYLRFCNRVIAAVPLFPIDGNSGGDGLQSSTDLSPRYYMNLPSVAVTALDTPASLHIYRFYHGSTTPSSSLPLQKEDPVYSPFHASSRRYSAEAAAEQTNRPDDDSDNATQRPIATITSVLSDEGGMHRPYRHVISIRTAEGQHPTPGERASGTIDAILPVGGGFFIDPDEDLANACSVRPTGGGGRCRVEAFAAPVDIEQPAFASPMHVVRLAVSFEFAAAPLEMEMDVATVLHVRYPAPVGGGGAEGGSGRPGYVTVDVPPAYLYRGSVRTGRAAGDGGDAPDGGDLWGDTVHVGTEFDGARERLSIEIAAGRDGHYGTVVFVTVFVSIVGAFSMLQDLSRAAVWC